MDATQEADCIASLVARLGAGADSEAARDAARALMSVTSVATDADRNEVALRDAGGIAPLVALLGAGVDSQAAGFAAGALMNASINDTNAEAIFAAGGIAPLVALLEAGADSVAATYAAGALMYQAFHASSAEAIRAAGGIAPLVALLGAGADSEAASYAVNALMNLAASTICAEAIREAGGIAPLVALLGAGAELVVACDAAAALWNLARDAAGAASIREAGGIAPLVAWSLGPGADSEASGDAAGALTSLADDATNADAILEGVALLGGVSGAAIGFHSHRLHRLLICKLFRISKQRLAAAEAGDNVATLERAIRHGSALDLPPLHEAIRSARERLAELRDEAALRARRETLGLGELPLPHEFKCPITYARMKDPVVASDGHSYERSAIVRVLAARHPRSPLTREPLERTLFANRNLKKRIEQYEKEVLQAAERAVAHAVPPERAGASSSSEPPAKRTRGRGQR